MRHAALLELDDVQVGDDAAKDAVCIGRHAPHLNAVQIVYCQNYSIRRDLQMHTVRV